ncbi:tRNA-splicing endonuclease subunit sen54 N-term-domain-containing protein [Biscogniauxia marginata]|nr:tRNA-splicing endonuclease subunit sen54 N-term-domain-containing protein [Biscogniauxia marginata]
MPSDDEDPAPASSVNDPAAATGENDGGGDVHPSLEDDDDAPADDKTQDFRHFNTLFNKRQALGRTVRRGEKDFESHGTRAQEGQLESSRAAMHEVLSYTRTHKSKDYLRGWYFPDRWADMPAGEKEDGGAAGLFARERVVVLESDKGTMAHTTGRVVTGAEKHSPGWLKTWLLPEEALYLVERGSLDLWWPARGIEDVLVTAEKGGEDSSNLAENAAESENRTELADYELGVPLSLQGAYALLVGRDGERGKVSLEKYQVYANLRRSGYRVLRATSSIPPPMPTTTGVAPGKPPLRALWEWLVSLTGKTHDDTSTPVTKGRPRYGYGPLVRPGLYRSYGPIYAQLALIPRHKPTPTLLPTAAIEPFRVHYHAWNNTSAFTKARPPPPDFRIAVVDARSSGVPTLEEMSALLESGTPLEPPPPQPEPGAQQGGAGPMYRRLKHAWRNAVVAVVDTGMVSYLRFGEMAFAEERLYERFVGGGSGGSGGGKGKRGGRGAGRGRGGRGGRGRGSGRGA